MILAEEVSKLEANVSNIVVNATPTVAQNISNATYSLNTAMENIMYQAEIFIKITLIVSIAAFVLYVIPVVLAGFTRTSDYNSRGESNSRNSSEQGVNDQFNTPPDNQNISTINQENIVEDTVKDMTDNECQGGKKDVSRWDSLEI